MNKSLFLDGYTITDVTDFEDWLRNKCNFDKVDCETVLELYDDELQASENLALYHDLDKEYCWYQDHVSNIRNEIMYIVEDMQERLTGKESRQQLGEIYDLLEEL